MKYFLKYISEIEEAIENEMCEITEDELHYQLYYSTKAAALKPLLALNIEDIFEYFGKSLRITITPEYQASTVYNKEKGIDFFIEELTDYIDDNGNVIFIFNINKSEFLKEKFSNLNADNYTIRIFRNQESFANFIKVNTIFNLQKRLFSNGKRLVVLVPDINQYYDNGILKICGGCNFSEALKKLEIESDINTLSRLQERVGLRDKEVRWEDKLNYITPEFFNFKGISNKVLKPLLDSKMVDCVITFLADVIKVIDDKYVCQFNGYKCTEIIIEENINDILCPTEIACETAFDLYDWTYESSFSDKIMIVRNIVSKYLRENASINYAEFLNNIADILNASKANYSIFFQSKIDRFFEDRKKIVQYTFDKTKDVEKEINSLTDSMTKNVVTAVGVILAAIIANSTKTNFSTPGIKIAIAAYLFYLIISTIYNLVAPVISLVQQYFSNSHLIKYYTTFVPENEIKKVQGNVFKNKLIFFWVYWGISFLIMLFLIASSIYAITNIDSILNSIQTL